MVFLQSMDQDSKKEKQPKVHEIKHLSSDSPLWTDGVVKSQENPIRPYFTSLTEKQNDEATLFSASKRSVRVPHFKSLFSWAFARFIRALAFLANALLA